MRALRQRRTSSATAARAAIRRLLVLPFVIMCAEAPQSGASWIEPRTLDATVLIEKEREGDFAPHGVGILLFNYRDPAFPVVVTCAHVLKRSSVYVSLMADSSLVRAFPDTASGITTPRGRTWLVSQGRLRCEVDLSGGPNISYAEHPSLDIAAFPLDIPQWGGLDPSISDTLRFSRAAALGNSMTMKRKDVELGDEVYFVGFPRGIGAGITIEPVVRSGSVAWMPKDAGVFLLDAFSFGGNSGSPVFLKQIVGRDPRRIVPTSTRLVGMVIGHEGISIPNVMIRTGERERPFFNETIDLNLGLARCVWVDDMLEVAQTAERLQPRQP